MEHTFPLSKRSLEFGVWSLMRTVECLRLFGKLTAIKHVKDLLVMLSIQSLLVFGLFKVRLCLTNVCEYIGTCVHCGFEDPPG
jgi:hypothetical protein